MTKVMIANRHFSNWSRGQNTPGAWMKLWEYNGADISADIPLTPKAIKHWQASKDCFGCAPFRGESLKKLLSPSDIVSIVSASKRGEANLYINRLSEVIGYKLKLI